MKKGFSLVEVVLVVLMVGFIILLISNLPSSVKLIGDSKSVSVAREIANHKIEDLRSQGYDNIANGTTAISDSRLSKLPSSSGEVLIEDCPSSICKNSELIKQVSVSVRWTEGGKSRDVKITTLISKGGLR